MLLTLSGLSGLACISGVALSMYWSPRIQGIADNWRGAVILLLILGGAAITAILLLIQIVVFVFTNV